MVSSHEKIQDDTLGGENDRNLSPEYKAFFISDL